jgi:hypothetical protein
MAGTGWGAQVGFGALGVLAGCPPRFGMGSGVWGGAGGCEGSKGICEYLQIVSGILDRGVATFTYTIVKFGAFTPSSCIAGDQFVLNLADFVLVSQSASEVHFTIEASS